MGFWPFGGSKRQRSSELGRQGQEKLIESQNLEDNARLEKASTDLGGDAKRSLRRNRDSRLLSRSQGTGSDHTPRSQTDPISVPESKRLSRSTQQAPENPLYQHEPESQSSLGPENFTVIRQAPTLHARRSDHGPSVGRRKSSKRKAEDHARELEVRAMSSSPIPIPKRPNSFYASGPLQRETKQIPGKLNRKLARPASEVSLPLPDAFPGISDLSTQNSFKVGAFAALSPRPTVKYDSNPNIGRGKQTQSQRLNVLVQPSILQEEGAEKKRIDELADELDAGGLRELMERDKRRRERKKEQDRIRLQRKLQRRADRQREEEARIARTEEYVHESASRVGLGIQSPKIEQADTGESEAGPSGTFRNETLKSYQSPMTATPISPVVIRNPFEDENELDVMRDEGSDHEPEPPIPAKSPLRKLQTGAIPVIERPTPAALSPPTSPVPRADDRQSMSQGSLLNREVTTDAPENASLEGRASDHSSQRLSSWTTFFRRGTRRKLSSSFQGRSTPSEFSNTSRESFAARKQPIPPAVAPRTFRRADSATPQRTMSKFREDLPELPISPPDSRLQSPETMDVTPSGLSQAIAASAKQPGVKSPELENTNKTASTPVPTKTSTGQDASMDLDMPGNVRADMALSQSLASVDSEGSWLSGRALNRLSGPSQRLKASRSSLGRTMPGAFDGSNDMAPTLDAPSDLGRSVTRRDSQKEKGDETWHAGIGRQPTLIRQASKAKSKEGLLNEYTAKEEHPPSPESDDEAQTTGDDEAEAVESTIMRARSVDYKGHIRHISGGSARLLDIRRQSSVSETSLRQQEKRRAASHDELSKQPPL